MSGFRSVRYSNGRDWHKIEFENRPRFGIRMLTVYMYSEHPKAGLSGFQMVISRTLFGSGIQMAFESRSENFLASLDRFGMNKIFFMTLFFIKRSRLAPFETLTQKSGFRMVKNKMADLA